MTEPKTPELLLVAGVGRSGTSLMTGVLGGIGWHLPQPEVEADETNPRGFSEPRWVVDFHQKLLRAKRVTVNDARPAAFADTRAAGERPAAREELRAWLKGEFAQSPAVAVKDPRTSWFLPLWAECARDIGVATSFVTMLRHPAEIIASARKSYGTRQTAASRAGAWINVTLVTELQTRGARRAFVRYEDLIADWEREIRRVGTALGRPDLATLSRTDHPAVDAFVDPTLHRNRVGWDEFDVPDRLRDLAEDVWRDVQLLVDPAADTAAVEARLDAARTAYEQLYAESEALAWSSITAAEKAARRASRNGSPAAAAAPSLRVRLARRIPARYRSSVRRALGRS